jgi:RNA polymerase sigma-70 factor (ECF subfamily)
MMVGSVDPVERLFQRLFDEELTYVWNTLRRLGVREADREDLVQEVFVRVHAALSTYDASRSPRPWLFAFAFRVASDFRRLKRHTAEVAATEDFDAASTDALADESLDAARRRAHLYRALDALDLDKRAVVVLHEIEGRPIPEVARTLEIPVGTASSRLRAGKQQLAEALRSVDDSQTEGPRQ